jgi:addiction module HigA family antidote
MHKNTLTSRANRERILATATRNIAEHCFHHATRPRIMAGSGLAIATLQAHFPNNTLLLAAICERHARALLEATGCVDPDDPAPPRAALVATAARILACIDARPDAHAVLMRDRPCLPAPALATLDHLDEVAAFQIDCAWSAIRPDLATPDRLAGLTRPLRTLLLRWPDWREPGAAGHPEAAADRAVAMVEATVDRPVPRPAPPPPAPPNPHAHWLSDAAAARTRVFGPPASRLAAQDTTPRDPPVCLAPQDTPRLAAQDTPGHPPGHAPGPATAPAPDAPDRPAHPGLTLRDSLARHGLTSGAAAARLGLTRQRLHEVIHGTRAITPDTALRLETLLDERAETWMARQARHDLETCRRTAATP